VPSGLKRWCASPVWAAAVGFGACAVVLHAPQAVAQSTAVPPPPSLQHLIQEAPEISGASARPGASSAASTSPTAATTQRRAANPSPVASCTPTRTLQAGRTALPAPASTQPATTPTAETRSEPAIDCIVVDDDIARIEELRVRGLTQRIVVRPKDGSAPYEIQLLDAGRDPAAKSGPGRGGAGQRVWPVLAF
jgi:hypothetical protein